MSELEINGYLICSKCNSTNRVVEIGRQGVYKCGTCRNDLLVINKEKKGSKVIPLNCKANYSQLEKNWSSEKIAKICTCLVTYIVERTDYPKWGRLRDAIVNESNKECR